LPLTLRHKRYSLYDRRQSVRGRTGQDGNGPYTAALDERHTLAMAVHRDLTALQVSRLLAAKKEARHRVSRSLYLQVKESGAGSWLFRYQRRDGTKRNVWVGLGRAKLFSLVEARHRAAELEKQLASGLDPLALKREGKRAEKQAEQQAAIDAVTFKKAAEAFIHAHWASWRSLRHREQMANSLFRTYDRIGALPVGAVDVEAVLSVLKPMWAVTPDSASRLRGRIESVLDFAKAHGWRTGENPARWKGGLKSLLPRPKKVRPPQHFSAMPFAEVPSLIADLANRFDDRAAALLFCILTASRTGEVRSCAWDEIDLDAAVWTIPGPKMKSGRPHRVPLSDAAIACLPFLGERGVGDTPSSDFVFGHDFMRGRKPLGENALINLLNEVRPGLPYTVHGFRSSFRDWCAECTDHAREVAEAALAHAVGDSTERAYRRGDALLKRRRLMADWAGFCMAAPPLAADPESRMDGLVPSVAGHPAGDVVEADVPHLAEAAE
jgi:integrase